MSRLAETLASIAAQPNTQAFETAVLADLRGLIMSTSALASISAASREWRDVSARIREMAAAVDAQLKDYSGSLMQELRDLELETGLLVARIRAATGLAALQVVAAGVVTHVASREKALVARALQTRALDRAIAGELSGFVAEAIKQAAKPLDLLHLAAIGPLESFLGEANAALQLLVTKEVLDRLSASLADAKTDKGQLAKIAAASPSATISIAEDLATRWRAPSGPALVSVGEQVIRITGDLLNGNLAAVVIQRLEGPLRLLEQQLREMITQFIPVGAKLEYTFRSPLEAFPSSNPIFLMTNGSRPDDLIIESTINIDFLSGKRSASITGKLNEFTIKLLGSIPMADIRFKKASFTLEPGQSPKFDMAIKEVQLNQCLEFIKPLQEWLAPGDSGFYLRPIVGANLGIEAGYTFAAGVIQIGTVQFIDVSFGVSARLYFDGSEAEFAFYLASPQRPFLIANPPYGGGGYVVLIANARGIKSMELSFVMGAVTAISFGPLRGYGRVTAGFGLKISGEERTIFALVEAMGEGSVAFFSIAIALRVMLIQQTREGSSSMYGTANYSYRFKLGFIRYRYGVTARYTVKGRKKSGSKPTAAVLPPVVGAIAETIGSAVLSIQDVPRLKNTVPLKSRNWRRYRACIDHGLLN